MQHVLSQHLLSDRQFGFRPGCSTMEAVLACTQDWHEVLDEGGSVASVFFDLSKAFDSPWSWHPLRESVFVEPCSLGSVITIYYRAIFRDLDLLATST